MSISSKHAGARKRVLVTREAIPSRYANERKAKCLKPDCWREARSRGLCSGCFASAWVAIERGDATEAELVEHGKMLKRQRNTRLWLLDFKK